MRAIKLLSATMFGQGYVSIAHTLRALLYPELKKAMDRYGLEWPED
jgi:hypothetical protein